MITRLVFFFILNFGTLAFTGPGVTSEWYQNLNKAPWTPPGWVFGVAWTTIMISFSIYMAVVWDKLENRNLLVGLYVVQLILNIAWNPVFFHFQNALIGLFIISTLTLIVGYFLLNFWKVMDFKSLLVAPYFIWLLIATSLNAYILFKN